MRKLYTDVYSQFVYDIIFLKEIITAILYKTTSGALYCKYVWNVENCIQQTLWFPDLLYVYYYKSFELYLYENVQPS